MDAFLFNFNILIKFFTAVCLWSWWTDTHGVCCSVVAAFCSNLAHRRKDALEDGWKCKSCSLPSTECIAGCLFQLVTHGHVDRGIIHKYGSVELLSKHIHSLFLIFCEQCCKKSFLGGITHWEGWGQEWRFYCERDLISSGRINKLWFFS